MTTPGFGGMGLLDSFMFGGGFEILFFLIFALVLCLFIVMIVRGVSPSHDHLHPVLCHLSGGER